MVKVGHSPLDMQNTLQRVGQSHLEQYGVGCKRNGVRGFALKY